MNSTEEQNFKICTQCNKRVISFPNNLCRKQILSSIDNETSGNIKLDEFIKETQLNSKFCDDFIEWIPYSNLENIKYLTSGGNSKIYFGNWLYNKSLGSKSSLNVVLKVIRVNDSLKEFQMHHKCRGQNVIPFYGMTKAPEGAEYAMVIQCAKYGDLRNYIRKFFPSLNWTDKANILIKVSKALDSLHRMNLFHKDFHCKNILVDEEHRILINDFELCQSSDTEIAPNILQGVLPYIAPEVLRRKPYTKQSEVYSISMIMWELTSKKPPFSDWVHDVELALAILDGMRPKIVEGTPEFYADIMKQCWNTDPLQRPDASFLPKIFEGMMELCKMADNNIYSPRREYQPDIINNSNENTESVYITEAYNYSLGRLSISTGLQDNDQPEFEEKKITKEFSIELTNQIKYYESLYINSSFDINSSTIEDKIVKQCDDNKFRKMRYKKNLEYDDGKRAYKLRRYQIAGKLRKKNRRSVALLEDDDEIVLQISESEDSRYATQTYDFSLEDLNKSYNEL
ncbi:hypothetical protein RclHR1_10940003 [Rhizophagus clarus]|uniref:Kinase-like domain-containing protein n=1 Tax=Rhizophagus clarus TaxID=94130 RepID=A0A2Z6Q2W3_9GLOM|nr:hypothetical protein RclHR1_10940003 [Rhizophagus clarus]GES77941.1 kinase-like domain-containing protein [Rhizophagus clarus]